MILLTKCMSSRLYKFETYETIHTWIPTLDLYIIFKHIVHSTYPAPTLLLYHFQYMYDIDIDVHGSVPDGKRQCWIKPQAT